MTNKNLGMWTIILLGVAVFLELGKNDDLMGYVALVYMGFSVWASIRLINIK